MRVYGRLESYEISDWYIYPVANYVTAWRHFEHFKDAKGSEDTLAHLALAITQLIPVLGLISFAVDASLGNRKSIRYKNLPEYHKPAVNKGKLNVANGWVMKGNDAATLRYLTDDIKPHINVFIGDPTQKCTLLHQAAYMRLSQTLTKLIELGADVTIKNVNGLSAADLYRMNHIAGLPHSRGTFDQKMQTRLDLLAKGEGPKE